MTVRVDGAKLKIRDVVRASRPNAKGRFEKALLDPGARERIAATRAYIDRHWMNDDAPLMYAFNTGVGLFKDQRVLIADMTAYQQKTVYAHATGIGEPFAEDVTRAMMLLRANAFASNYSGPRVELVERLIAFLNAGLHPVIPQKGSVGASGDLAPLAHMAGAVCGFAEAEMIYRGRRMPAREAIAKAGFTPDFDLGAKDASPSSTARPLRSRSAHWRRAMPDACSNMRTSPCASRSRPCAASLRPSIPGCRRRVRIRVSCGLRAISCASSRDRCAARKAPAT